MSDSAWALASAVIFSFLISRSRLPATVARPLSSAACAMSTMTTRMPLVAQAWAMPLPMVPEPMMPTVWMLLLLMRKPRREGSGVRGNPRRAGVSG
jgi:hypothetical protein